MTFSSLVANLPDAVVSGDKNLEISHITTDSRAVKPGSLFIAMRGETVDGAKFIDKALENGAAGIVSEVAVPIDFAGGVWAHVKDARHAAGVIADIFYDRPSRAMKVIGVTGTNGKTTTSFLLHHVMRKVWQRSGLLGTLVMSDGVSEVESVNTTPDSLTAHQKLAAMRDNGCRGMAMEVSSHGLDQQRTAGIHFDCAIFTNLTQDHLDYHRTMTAYMEAKKKLFTGMVAQGDKRKPDAVINIDGLYGEKLALEMRDLLHVRTYGYSVHADYRAINAASTARGSSFELVHKDKRYLVKIPLVGRFNISNVLAVIAAAHSVGIKVRDAVRALADVPQVPGRLEFVDTISGASVVVDYAHTPDALQNVCRTIRELEPNRIFTLFGCGGDRDKSKRPQMAKAACELSDFVILTSDNPRSEDPEAILKDAERGLRDCPSETIVDREEAIERAINSLRKGDVLIIAGKGHETYQEIKGVKHSFDDREVARRYMKTRLASSVKEARIKDEEWAKKRAMRDRQQGDRHWENRDGRPPREPRERDFDREPRREETPQESQAEENKEQE